MKANRFGVLGIPGNAARPARGRHFRGPAAALPARRPIRMTRVSPVLSHRARWAPADLELPLQGSPHVGPAGRRAPRSDLVLDHCLAAPGQVDVLRSQCLRMGTAWAFAPAVRCAPQRFESRDQSSGPLRNWRSSTGAGRWRGPIHGTVAALVALGQDGRLAIVAAC